MPGDSAQQKVFSVQLKVFCKRKLFDLIRTFCCRDSFLYLGILCKSMPICSVQQRVFSTPELFDAIRTFYCRDSFFYLGILCKDTDMSWSGKKTTAFHLVAKSRSRISRLLRLPSIAGQATANQSGRLLALCMSAAARHGDIPGVKRIEFYSTRREIRLSSSRQVDYMASAARSGCLPMLEYLNLPIGKNTFIEAIKSPNSVNTLTWLLERRKDFDFDDDVEAEAAKIGNIPALRVLSERERFPGFSDKVIIAGIRARKMKLVQFLLYERCALTPAVMCAAAYYGDLGLVIQLRDMNCKWDDRVCWFAAFHGHLDVLQWLRAQNPPCPWGIFTLSVAIMRKHDHIVEFCRRNGLR